jgi:hypothetical protein
MTCDRQHTPSLVAPHSPGGVHDRVAMGLPHQPVDRLPVESRSISPAWHPVLAQLREIHGNMLCSRMIKLRLGRSDELMKKIPGTFTIVGRLIEGEGR